MLSHETWFTYGCIQGFDPLREFIFLFNPYSVYYINLILTDCRQFEYSKKFQIYIYLVLGP